MNKKFLGKKGQGAMEYLMTYGWAILVVMIVGVVLWQLGIFSGSGSSNKATGFSTGKIGAIDASIKCDVTDLTVTMTNQAGSTLSAIIVTPSVGYTGAVTGFGPPAGSTLETGEKATMTIAAPATPPVVGDKVITSISIAFNERVAGDVIARTQKGQILCTVE